MTPRTVLLIPTHDVSWVALRHAAASLPGVRAEDVIGDTDAVMERVDELRPAAIITAARFLDEPVTPLLRLIRRRLRAAVFVIIDDGEDEAALPDLASAGVAAYLLWPRLTTATLRSTLEVALSGTTVVLSNEVAEAYDRLLREPTGPSPRAPTLSDREFSVLRLLARGRTRNEIAEQLAISPRTVDRTIDDLKTGLEAPTRESLMVTAVNLGLVR